MSKVCSIKDLSAVILAGGLGTRLQPVLPSKQKVVADVRGKPFVFYLLEQLSQVGVSKVIFCVGHLAEQVQELIGNHYKTIKISYSLEAKRLGTGGALRNALDLIDSDPFLVLNGDSFCEVDLNSFFSFFWTKKAETAICLREVPDTSRYGSVQLSEDLSIKGFLEKNKKSGTGWINAGIYLFTKKTIEVLKDGDNISLELDVFPKLVGTNSFYGFKVPTGKFIDIGTPESFIEAEDLFA